MESIQHRLDCPARLRSDPDAVEVVSRVPVSGYVVVHRRCRYCGRASQIREPAGEQP
jgi:hypothetical protein